MTYNPAEQKSDPINSSAGGGEQFPLEERGSPSVALLPSGKVMFPKKWSENDVVKEFELVKVLLTNNDNRWTIVNKTNNKQSCTPIQQKTEVSILKHELFVWKVWQWVLSSFIELGLSNSNKYHILYLSLGKKKSANFFFNYAKIKTQKNTSPEQNYFALQKYFGL